MGTEMEVKYERSSLLPTKNILKTSPGSMPENELRSKIHGLYDGFFLWDLWTSFQNAGYEQLPRQIQCT